MDYSSFLKETFEKNDLTAIFKQFNLDNELIFNALNDTNICFSNHSFFFVYLEQAACILALGLNKLCKSSEKSFSQSFQRLNINSPPVGTFKRCLINQAGTHVLLIYDKSLLAIELPSVWGKYEQFEDGKLNIMCKCVKFNLNSKFNVIDAVWHPRNDESLVCLTNDHNMKFFKIANSKSPVKEFHLTELSMQADLEPNLSANDLVSKTFKLLNIEIGSRFEYNDKYAYPIYILKSNGQVDCLIEYDTEKTFDFVGSLTLVPYCMDHEGNQVVSFTCLPTKPNCIVLLLTSGLIYHCIFMPNIKYNIYESSNFNESMSPDFNGDSILYIYESITINTSQNVKFIKDPMNAHRYFTYHLNGVHSLDLQWLDNLSDAYQKTSINEFDQSNLCEINHLVSTKAFIEKKSTIGLIGSALISNFGNTSQMLVSLNNQGKFICNFVQTPSKDELKSNESVEDSFTNYVTSLLKRDSNLPIIKSDIQGEVSENELNTLIRNAINLIKIEYIEKQKSVINAFQKRCKILKQQEQLQNEMIEEIKVKNESLLKNKQDLHQKYLNLIDKQNNLQAKLEKCLNRLLENKFMPINEIEERINKELKTISTNLPKFSSQIKENKTSIAKNGELQSLGRLDVKLDEQQLIHVKKIMKNESDKLKVLMEKLTILGQTLKTN